MQGGMPNGSLKVCTTGKWRLKRVAAATHECHAYCTTILSYTRIERGPHEAWTNVSPGVRINRIEARVRHAWKRSVRPDAFAAWVLMSM